MLAYLLAPTAQEPTIHRLSHNLIPVFFFVLVLVQPVPHPAPAIHPPPPQAPLPTVPVGYAAQVQHYYGHLAQQAQAPAAAAAQSKQPEPIGCGAEVQQCSGHLAQQGKVQGAAEAQSKQPEPIVQVVSLTPELLERICYPYSELYAVLDQGHTGGHVVRMCVWLPKRVGKVEDVRAWLWISACSRQIPLSVLQSTNGGWGVCTVVPKGMTVKHVMLRHMQLYNQFCIVACHQSSLLTFAGVEH
eukprot:1106586-Pelagomonas_calceolata.AAC.2